MTEESAEPKPNKLKLSSSRNQPDKQQSAPAPKESTPVSPSVIPKADHKPKVTLRTASTQTASTPATPTPIAAKPVAKQTPPPVAKQPTPIKATPPQPRQSPPRISNSAPKPAEQPTIPTASAPLKDDPLGSILIVAALLSILVAAAGGIWYLFQSDQPAPTEEAARLEASPTNPVERAKTAIASVPDRNLDHTIAPQAAPKPEVTTETKIEAIPETPQPTLPAEAAPTVDLKAVVSNYLQTVHIGGVRTGAKARIMLNGENYNINDTVDTATGLIFIGTRDQKLLFKDPNGVTYVKSF
ncbi:MAG: hypothetical protein ACI8Z5_002423 [Lentimonas sp.]|jgi:hypothetical protein